MSVLPKSFLQGIILVYDITRQETFNNIRKWLRYVDEVSVMVFRNNFIHQTGYKEVQVR